MQKERLDKGPCGSTLVHALRQRAVEAGARRACSFFSEPSGAAEHLNYEELDRHARRVAACLQRLGRPGRALLLYPPGLDFVTAFLGCLYAGTIAVPVELPRVTRNSSRLEGVIKDSQPTVILTVGRVSASRDRINGLTGCLDQLDWLATEELSDGLEMEWSEINPSLDDIAMLQYTSGSTALPRGVVVTHENIIRNSEFIQRSFQHTRESYALSWLPHFHDMGLMGTILHPLHTGFPFALMSPLAVLQKPIRWLEAISLSRATTSGGPNFAYELCVRRIRPEDRKGIDLSCWEIAFNGSEPVRAETLERFADAFRECGFRREAFFPCYGLAEATLLVSAAPKTAPPTIRDRSDVIHTAQDANGSFAETVGSDRRMVSCGQTDPEHRLVIVDPKSKTLCAEGEVGEVWFAGPSVAAGYWKRPSDTTETFRAVLADSTSECFLRTGDLGVIRAGELYITGRMKDIIIIAGLNHYPEDIERTVEQSTLQLTTGCCASFPVVADGEEQLIVAVELDRHCWKEVRRARERSLQIPARAWRRITLGMRRSAPSESWEIEEELAGSIREAVVRNHGIRPQDIVFLPPGRLPRTGSGKVRRHACRDAYLTGGLARDTHGGRQPAQRIASASEATAEESV